VAADVSQNATDHAGFKPIVEQVERNLGNLPKDGSAYAGYSSYDNLEFAEGKGLDLYMPALLSKLSFQAEFVFGITR